MVRALLDGRKTQTRRLLSLSGYREFTEFGKSEAVGFEWTFRRADMCWCDFTDEEMMKLLPYSVGDRLYVREAHRAIGGGTLNYCTRPEHLDFRASPPSDITGNMERDFWDSMDKWHPGIHHHRQLTRLTLTVTDVRVQRLQDISEEDAVAEGIEHVMTTSSGKFYRNFDNEHCPILPVGSFRSLWNSLNAKRAPWDSNPWVVAVSFDVKKGNIDA
ncbi:hypothetical protein [Parasphingorhabdus sp.]|uniref:hypothetical protein n=1 Tax=Parasphingorhabdus sp. TaxID=2709688 RepID=UPI003A953193